MTSPRARFPWLRAAGFGAAALAVAAAACETPGPVQTSPTAMGTRMEAVRTESSTAIEEHTSGVRISRAAIDAAVRAHFPEVFQAAPADEASLLFVVNPDGTIARHERVQLRRMGVAPSDVPEAAAHVRQASKMSDDEMRQSMVDVVGFSPGQMGPGRVDVLWIRKLAPEDQVTTTTRTRVSAPAGQLPAEGSQFRTSAAPRKTPELTLVQAREYVARYLPEVARNGTTAEFVWIIADAAGRVVETGDSRNSEPLNRDVDRIDEVQVLKGENLVFNGHPVGLVYVRMKG